MQPNQKNIYEVLAKVKNGLGVTLAKIRQSKFPLPRLSASLLHQTTNKTKQLRAKYSHSRLRSSINKKNTRDFFGKRPNMPQRPQFSEILRTPIQKIKDLRFPKFSLSQLPVPGSFPKLFNCRVAVATLVLLAFAGFFINANLSLDAFAVEVNGKKVAIITEKADAEKLLSNLKAEKSRVWKRNVDCQQTLTFKNIKAKKYQIDNTVALKNKLSKSLTFVAVATGIKVNGQLAVVVKDNQTAEDVLGQMKSSFKADGVKIDTVGFQEKVEIAQVPVTLGDVLTADNAVEFLKQGKQKQLKHIITQGDSLWTIARKYDMHIEDLLKINPAIKGEHLDLGQQVILVALEPVLNVVITGEQTLKETLPYKVVVQSDRSMWRGREKVKTHGKNGVRQVSYKVIIKNGSVVSNQVVQEKVLQAATNQVVTRGSRFVVASRSGSGKVGWPISGRITSGYGRRWGSMHTGIDIDGYKGQPVGAASAGMVVSAGWEGGYGKMVVIRHNNGLVTRYGHLSKIEVSSGQSVSRGDLIGLVGSTGHSTGSHLHFEVLNGGSFQNPTKLLK